MRNVLFDKQHVRAFSIIFYFYEELRGLREIINSSLK